MREKLSPQQKKGIARLVDHRDGQACICGLYKPPGRFFCVVCYDLLTPGHKIALAHARPRSEAQLNAFEAAREHIQGVING